MKKIVESKVSKLLKVSWLGRIRGMSFQARSFQAWSFQAWLFLAWSFQAQSVYPFILTHV
jgi:hypothetical protein